MLWCSSTVGESGARWTRFREKSYSAIGWWVTLHMVRYSDGEYHRLRLSTETLNIFSYIFYLYYHFYGWPSYPTNLFRWGKMDMGQDGHAHLAPTNEIYKVYTRMTVLPHWLWSSGAPGDRLAPPWYRVCYYCSFPINEHGFDIILQVFIIIWGAFLSIRVIVELEITRHGNQITKAHSKTRKCQNYVVCSVTHPNSKQQFLTNLVLFRLEEDETEHPLTHN